MPYRRSPHEDIQDIEQLLDEGWEADGQWALWGTDLLSYDVHTTVTSLDRLLGLDADTGEDGGELPDEPVEELAVESALEPPPLVDVVDTVDVVPQPPPEPSVPPAPA
jgi:hypothetical protein